MQNLYAQTWATADLGEALTVLARHRGLTSVSAADAPAPPTPGAGGAAWEGWVAALAQQQGLEAEPTEVAYSEIDDALRQMAPALVRLNVAGEHRFLALAGRSRQDVHIIGPDHRQHRVDPAAVRHACCHDLEAPVVEELDRLMARAGLSPSPEAREVMLRERLGSRLVPGFWVLQLPPSAPFVQQLRQAGLGWRFGGLMGAHALQYVLWLVAWWLIGAAALQGHIDYGWLVAWAFLLLTLVPLRLLVTWWQGALTIRAGALLQRRLLFGALQLRPDEVRHQGVGQLLGRVIESREVETLALSGGILALVASIELGFSAVVLGLGAGAWWQVGALVAWLILTALLVHRYYGHRQGWTRQRLTMTHGLVERMVGHRTRLAQQPPERWHDGEDPAVAAYLDGSKAMDRSFIWLTEGIPRGWLFVGVAALTPAFVASATPAGLAVGLGGVLLAYRALYRMATGLSHLAGAAIAWAQVAPLFDAATRTTDTVAPLPAHHAPVRPAVGQPLLEAHGLSFGYAGRGAPVLDRCSFTIRAGERLLLEGPSGSGKSTLAALLTGLRHPDAGLLLLGGLDRATLGTEGWRARVVSAPQFHENHVLTGTFAFNLLMGRQWPPSVHDLDAAERLCRELGLGPLLDRMPAGLNQMVGETGWQLSHGERSRLFLARALLQEADLVLLDESFGALDPDNLARAMECVLRRTPTLVAIAHP